MDEIVLETRHGTPLGATRTGTGPAELVFLHAGVADRRSWRAVMDRLADRCESVAFDRPGYGGTPPAREPYRATDHLHDAVGSTADRAVVLVGNSQGGRIAIDFALAEPDRVRALVLVASVTSGDPPIDWEVELGTELVAAIEAAEKEADLDAVNRYDARVWLDGPRSVEGRVSGDARALFLEMNAIALRNDDDQAPELEPEPAVDRLPELAMPVLVITGALDLTALNRRCTALARTVRDGRHVELADTAHLPSLERPDEVTRVLTRFLDEIRV